MNALVRLPRTQLFALTAVLIAVAMVFANFLDVGGNVDDVDEEGSAGDYVILTAFGLLITALLLFVAVPRLKSAGTAVVFGVLAIITLVAFWSTLPFAFGAAAIAASAPRDGQPTSEVGGIKAAVVLGLLAWVAAFVACVIG